MNIVQCRSCQARIFWAKSAKSGAAMPIDADPIEGGNIRIINGEAHVLSGDMAEEMMRGPAYQSHFVSCPHAARHRKGDKNAS